MDEHEDFDLVCPNCGEPCDGLVTVDYDAMVDGPGDVMSEDMCVTCAERGDNGNR
jgi:hypothetical protein